MHIYAISVLDIFIKIVRKARLHTSLITFYKRLEKVYLYEMNPLGLILR